MPPVLQQRERAREREKEREQKGDIVSSLPDDSFTKGGIELGPPSYTHSILGWNAEL
jgi:hypothetical protein